MSLCGLVAGAAVYLVAPVLGWGWSVPDYSVTLEGPDLVRAGEVFHYRLSGTGVLQLLLPPGVQLIGMSLPATRGQDGHYSFGPYPNGTFVDVFVRAPLESTRLVATASTPGNDSKPENNVARLETTVWLPRLRGAAPRPEDLVTRGRLVWIGAHPDDELLVAGLLGALCAEGEARCTLVTATRGEAGECLLPEGCHPDLAAVRSNEFRTSAMLVHADALLGDLPDGSASEPAVILQNWYTRVGGAKVLDDIVIQILRDVDTVITFDPRHGSSCHADHRAVGILVVKAIESMGSSAPDLFFLEDLIEVSPVGTEIVFKPAVDDPGNVLELDLTGPSLLDPDLGLWAYTIRLAEAYPSQFGPATLYALRHVLEADRRVWLLSSKRMVPADPRDLALCGN